MLTAVGEVACLYVIVSRVSVNINPWVDTKVKAGSFQKPAFVQLNPNDSIN